ncbi:hypothetical protein QUF58_11630 [Anaerolineales bacterium HSG24]|nr:hypothetical protein [Anaerolineales bacterium HSG24]
MFRQHARQLTLLFIVALFARLLTAYPQQQPNYMDATYYYVNAVNLAQGRGFVEDFLWHYLNNPDPPPQPSHLYWMPLTSMLAGGSMALVGISYRAAQLPFVLLSAMLAPLTFFVTLMLFHGRDSRQSHTVWFAWLAGLLAIFSGFYLPFWPAIDNFTPFAMSGSLALVLAYLAIDSPDQPGRYMFGSGVAVGLAHLSRADGALLFMVIGAFHLYWLMRARQNGSSQISGRSLFYLLLLLTGYLLILTPWLSRNWQVTGALLPAGTQTIWLTEYNDLFSYGRELSAQTFLAQGWRTILAGRWFALTINLQRVLAEWMMIFLLPLVMVGGWRLRQHALVQLSGLYALLLFLVMTFLFTFPGARGGLFHSAGAILPFIYGLALVGLNDSIDWISARRRGWHAQSAKYLFGGAMVLFAIALSGFVYYQRVLSGGGWNSADAHYPEIAAWIETQANHETTIIMINNPPAYQYHGGGLSIIIPNEDVTTTMQIIERYQVDYLVLDKNHPAPLANLYQPETSHPALHLVKTFAKNSDNEIYLFEVKCPID